MKRKFIILLPVLLAVLLLSGFAFAEKPVEGRTLVFDGEMRTGEEAITEGGINGASATEKGGFRFWYLLIALGGSAIVTAIGVGVHKSSGGRISRRYYLQNGEPVLRRQYDTLVNVTREVKKLTPDNHSGS